MPKKATKRSKAKPRQQAQPTSTGLSENFSALLCYLFVWIGAIIFLVLETKSRYVRFHALQSLIFFGFLAVLNMFISLSMIADFFVYSFVAPLISLLMWTVGIIFWVQGMVSAYNGQYYKFPVAGEIAEKESKKL
ncbi:MAG TPA: DUF4870 domain-containing protein [Candidatus Woesearchaeota archaeon]|nr:DUF4870 domain-containing protein [Candidatus Woesearchaeota archaeon]